MKKATFVLIWLLFALTMLYPAGALIAVCFGYTFELTSILAFSGIIAFLSIGIVILDLVFKNASESKAIRILLAVITPLSLLNAGIYILECPKIVVAIGAVISVGCSCFLTITHGKPDAIKSVALGLSGFMVLPIGFLCWMALAFGGFGCDTVVQTVESPNRKYYAQVIDSDQGALGGDTFVDVYEKIEINTFIFKIKKKAQRVYTGDWGDFKNMEIYWKDDDCLVINSKEHEIK